MTASARNALSVDLEEYFQVSNFDGVIARGAWDTLPSRLGDATRRLLDDFDATGSRATFFTLGWIAERHGALLREIERRGHEIACHGYAHELVYELGAERFRADLRRARAALEDAVGRPIAGYRAPSYSITRASIWALPILAEEGFTYDSSIFPIRHPRYGIPDFAKRPVRIDLGGDLSIREFPLTTLKLGPVTLPVAGGAYLRFLPAPVFCWGFDRVVAGGEPAVLYLHPWEIDPGQPRQPVGWRIYLNHYFNLSRTQSRLRRLLKRHAFDPVGEVLGALDGAHALPVVALPAAASAA